MINIILKNSQSILEQKLRRYINSTVNPIIFDITLDNISYQVLTLSDSGDYTLSYSRPLLINFFRPPLAEYEFIFSLKVDSSSDSVKVVGKIRLKRYVIGAVLLVCFIVLYKVYNIMYEAAPVNLFFLVIMPLILCFYLLVEYWFFRKKVKNFINNLL